MTDWAERRQRRLGVATPKRRRAALLRAPLAATPASTPGTSRPGTPTDRPGLRMALGTGSAYGFVRPRRSRARRRGPRPAKATFSDAGGAGDVRGGRRGQRGSEGNSHPAARHAYFKFHCGVPLRSSAMPRGTCLVTARPEPQPVPGRPYDGPFSNKFLVFSQLDCISMQRKFA